MRRTLILELVIAAAAAHRAWGAERPVCDRASSGGTKAAARRRIVVSIPDRKLALVDGGRIVRVYPAAVGKPATPSPTGTHSIAVRVPNPTYYAPGKAVPPGKENPLGTRWLGLTLKSYGIHGTNNSRSIGQAASHGCIRMLNRDVEELFDRVEVGDLVELLGERTEETARIFSSTPAAASAGGGQ
jgi:lipoprotein-anchoring transpeptidase ErfK/SrfK